jgi:hypothetical protein
MRPRRQEGGDADSSVNSPDDLATTSSRTKATSSPGPGVLKAIPNDDCASL